MRVHLAMHDFGVQVERFSALEPHGDTRDMNSHLLASNCAFV